MEAAGLTRYQVEAQNLSRSSENRIHDDSVARQFGFTGALVPGVEVYAYACHVPVDLWGREWLERGTIECRFAKPVYDGRFARVSADSAGDSLTIRVESDGICARTRRRGSGSNPRARPSLTR